MSETEHHKGKIVEVFKLDGESLEDFCKRISERENFKFDQRYNATWQECLEDNGYEQYIIVGERIFRIYDHSRNENDIFEVESNEDGTYSFYGSFYNGGTCLQEILEEKLSRII